MVRGYLSTIFGRMMKDCWNLISMLILMYVFDVLHLVVDFFFLSLLVALFEHNSLFKIHNAMRYVIWQDIQIRGVNRDEKHIQMAKQYPNSRHFLTYRHSLRVMLACLMKSSVICIDVWIFRDFLALTKVSHSYFLIRFTVP